MLQKQLAEFKKTFRKFNKYTVPDDQTWHLETSYANRNRLANAAVANRQAAVRGMPVVTDDDARRIMRTFLAMKGITKKKQLELWESGQLKLLPGDLKMQGTSHKWRSMAGSAARRNDKTIRYTGRVCPPTLVGEKVQYPNGRAAFGPSREREGETSSQAAFRLEAGSQLVCTSSLIQTNP